MNKIEQEINKYISNINALNLRTSDKLKALKKVLQDFDNFREKEIVTLMQGAFQVLDLITRIDLYLNRKRIGKSTENDIFKEVKEIALIRLKNIKINFK